MRGLGWAIAAVGIVVLLVATGLIGDRDRSGQTVPAGEWAQDVCAAVGVWRGEAEAISESFRLSAESNEQTESGAPTPEGKLGAAQHALERAIEAVDTTVEAIDRAGTPDTAQGEQAAEQISAWASGAKNDLEEAEDLLDEEGDSLEDDIENVTQAARQIAGALESGRQVIATVAASDPEIEAAIRDSSTCQQLRAETG
jgi:ABC-type transporter Mla subunit MlaD